MKFFLIPVDYNIGIRVQRTAVDSPVELGTLGIGANERKTAYARFPGTNNAHHPIPHQLLITQNPRCLDKVDRVRLLS